MTHYRDANLCQLQNDIAHILQFRYRTVWLQVANCQSLRRGFVVLITAFRNDGNGYEMHSINNVSNFERDAILSRIQNVM